MAELKGPTFREVVAMALVEADAEAEQTHPKGAVELVVDPADVARELQARLKAAGYSIHRSGECVHPWGPKPSELGREITPDEAILLGLLAVGDNLELDEEAPAT